MSTPPTAILSEEQILQLRNNNVSELDINLVDKGLNDTSIDWSELGQLIRTATNLKKLNIEGDVGRHWKSRERSRQLFKNIAASTSIENLILHNLASGTVIHLPLCIKSLANNLRSLEFWNCYHMGRNEYDALAKLLKDPDCIVENLAFSGVLSCFQETLRDALQLNTSVKKLHIEREFLTPIAWFWPSSAIEEMILTDMGMNNKVMTEIGRVLKDNTTLKVLGLYFGQLINTEGWAAFAASLRNNNALVELDLSDNSSINNEVLTGLMRVLAGNTTLTTLRLENLGQVNRDGWRSIATIYLQSPTCALENLYMGQNILDGPTFREFVDVCENNKILKNLCLRLPTTARGINTPRVGWNPWMNQLTRIVNNKRSIIDTYNSNHVLEAICYPEEEERFARDMATCELMGKNLPTYLLMNRSEQDKFALARRKIMDGHYLNQAVVTDNNRKYRDYKSLMDTILEPTDNMERTEQLPNMMAWVGRDNDGLSLMYELMQRMPSLCENVGRLYADTSKRQLRSSKRKLTD